VSAASRVSSNNWRASRIVATEVEIRAPAEQTEGTRSQVLRWLKSVGEEVVENEPLIELETDKVTVEVAAPGSGVLREILKREQDDVAPGEVLGRIGINGAGAGAGHVDGEPAAQGSVEPAAQRPPAALRARAGVAAQQAAPTSHRPPQPVAASAHLLSPAVKRLLAEHDIDPSSLRGSGEGGRITVQDVLMAAGAPALRGAPAGSAEGARVDLDHAETVPAGRSQAPASGGVRRVPHSPVRKRIAEHMVRSLLHTAPHVTTVFEADLTAVLAHRERNRDEFARQGAPLTLTAYFLQAAVAAIRAVPEANSHWTDSALEIFDSIHMGVATAIDDELVVPVLRNLETLDLLETARGLHNLVTRAREGMLAPADMRGGTFTISNHGVSGSLLATPIVINQPQSAILGVGKLERRVVVDSGEKETLSVQSRCYVTLTIDHRVLDGYRANRFLQSFVGCLAHWPASPTKAHDVHAGT
jgi:2-oxoglutarate dehydrogenase E2 component (dihydrolipoamide succinyltransferase)